MKGPINIHVHVEQNQESSWLSENIQQLCAFSTTVILEQTLCLGVQQL